VIPTNKGALSILIAILMASSAFSSIFLVGGSAGTESEEVVEIPPPDMTERIELPRSSTQHFTKNNGQWNSGLEYVGKSDTGYVGFDREGVYFNIIKEVEDDQNGDPCFTGHVIKLSFDDPNYLRPVGEAQIGAEYNYLIGQESNWVTHVPNYNEVTYYDVWDEIDVKYHYSDSGLKYDIIVEPGADLSNIRITMEGQRSIDITDDSLAIDVDGEVTLIDTELDVFYMDDPSEKIQQHIEADNPGVEGLKIEVQEGVAKVSGKAKDQSAFEKIVLMAGNVFGIGEVKAEELEVEEPAEIKAEYYVIQKGDTLWAIAQKFLGNGSKYTKIFEDNREVIKDPDLIYPGQKIRIVLD